MINISFKPKKRSDGVNVRAPMTKEAVAEWINGMTRKEPKSTTE